MSKPKSPWIRSRGLARILARETNVSDFIQYLSDLDPAPWQELVGFVPTNVQREHLGANSADLFLSNDVREAVVEVKLGHLLSDSQQEKYEKLPSNIDLYLSGLSMDESRINSSSERWTFRSLHQIFKAWEKSSNQIAVIQANEAGFILKNWDQNLLAVMQPRDCKEHKTLTTLNQKFLVRVITRRITENLKNAGFDAYSGVTLGGGIPIVQAWVPIRGERLSKAFIAEIRWKETKNIGELRFGVDFAPDDGSKEDELIRRAAFELASQMDEDIHYASLAAYLDQKSSHLTELISRDKLSRPKAKGDWEAVITNGFNGAPLPDGKKNNRSRTTPDFYGDGTTRLQAIADVNLSKATGPDLVEIIAETLNFLSLREP